MTEKKPMTIADLRPADSEIKLGEKVYKLKKYSLRYKAEMIEKFGLALILKMAQGTETENDLLLSYAAWLLIDEQGKRDFPTVAELRDAVVQPEDYESLVRGVSRAIGVAEASALTPEEEAELEKEKKTT
jgi:hypothetical protein